MTQTLNRPAAPKSATPPYRASEQVAGLLQHLHADLIDLHLQGKQLHWNVVGRNFRDLHLVLDEVVDAAREFSDQVAERMRAVAVVPDGRATTVVTQSSLPQLPSGEVDTADAVDLAVAALYAVAGTARRIHDDVDAEDPTTADILHGILERIEQLAWMIGAENRVAGRSAPTPIEA